MSSPTSRSSDSKSVPDQFVPAFSERFRFICPTLPPKERVFALYENAYQTGQVTNGSLVARFEAAVAERLGVKHCVAVSSCTLGLALVLRAYGLKGEAILPSFTFFATGHAALWNSLTPVFADCDPETWTVDPDDIERKITSSTSVILAVHMYGNPCHVAQLEQLATRHKVKLVFDAAHAFGSSHGGRPIGGFGDAEVFSLSPTKLLVAGEGGLVTTNDATLAHRLRAARNYGDLGAYDPEVLGLNARMAEYNAAMGLAGLEILDAKVKKHGEIASAYTSLLSDVPGLSFQKIAADDCCTYKDYSIHVNAAGFGQSRDVLATRLLAHNIETKKYFYPPLHKQRLYREFYVRQALALPFTDRVADGILSLPIYASLSTETVEKVSKTIRSLGQKDPEEATAAVNDHLAAG